MKSSQNSYFWNKSSVKATKGLPFAPALGLNAFVIFKYRIKDNAEFSDRANLRKTWDITAYSMPKKAFPMQTGHGWM